MAAPQACPLYVSYGVQLSEGRYLAAIYSKSGGDMGIFAKMPAENMGYWLDGLCFWPGVQFVFGARRT